MPRTRDTFNRFSKHVAAITTKRLQKEAEALGLDLDKIITTKLKEVHINNVKASFSPRAASELAKIEYNKAKKKEELEDRKIGVNSRRSRKKLSYNHSGILLDAIDTKTEMQNNGFRKISIVVKPLPYESDHPREQKVTATQVYDWLRKGTQGGGVYFKTGDDGRKHKMINYPTPIHPFEEHTLNEMKGFMKTLKLKNYVRVKKYKL